MEANKKQTGIFFWALLAVSFLVRLIRINQGFWYDELHTLLRFVFSSYQQILTSLPVPNNHILFTLLAKLSIGIFGLHEWSLRLPSLILGGLTPPLLYLFWRKRFSRFVSFAASLFLALSFWPVWFSQDARGYAGFILFSALSNIFFLSWLERPERNPGGLYVICSAIACYFYFYTGFIIAAQFAYAMVRLVRSGKPLKPRKYFLPLPAALISMALYAPGLSQLLKYYQLRGKDISFHWLNLQFAKDTIELLAGTHWLSFAVGAAILFLVGLPRLYKKWPGLVFLYLASAAFLILATWVLRIFIYARFLSFLIPFFFLAAAAAMEWIGENISARTTRLRKNHAAGFGVRVLQGIMAAKQGILLW